MHKAIKPVTTMNSRSRIPLLQLLCCYTCSIGSIMVGTAGISAAVVTAAQLAHLW
jgi:hypothetical protein